MYTKESLERLKEKIDLIDLLSSFLDLKQQGASFTGLCPFHDEKTPSFTVRKADTHYHCFGCGAHGDAIQFMMLHQGLSFSDAVEHLAERFSVTLTYVEEKKEEKDVDAVKHAVKLAHVFYHQQLLESKEAEKSRYYLLSRGIQLDFILRFQLGYSPLDSSLFLKWMEKNRQTKDILYKAGVVTKTGKDFFSGRITFPLHSVTDQVIGFSARKIDDSVYGGKYINTPETILFKKSRYLFGLNYSRRAIIKDSLAVLVEGQIDVLRLIEQGLCYTVAALGTAWTKEQVSKLAKMGVKKAYLLFDGDEAGKKAASRTGDLLLYEGIEPIVSLFSEKEDPDSFLQKHGLAKLLQHLQQGKEYLKFQIENLSVGDTPVAKSKLANDLKQQIFAWPDPILVHESIKRVSQLLDIPEETLEIPRVVIPPQEKKHFDFGRVLEMDCLRWLFLQSAQTKSFINCMLRYLTEQHFYDEKCRKIFVLFSEKKEALDMLTVITEIEEDFSAFFDELLQKKIKVEKANVCFLETVQRLVDRYWLDSAEKIKKELLQGKNEQEVFALAKQFDDLKRNRVKVCLNV